jgi:hypothetical protein
MKNLTLLVLLFFISTIGTAQQLFLDLGSSATSLEYLNSNGQSLENLHAVSNSQMQAGYRYSKPDDYLSYTLAVSYTGYGAVGSDTLYQNYMEYNLNYAQFHAGVDIKMFSYKGFDFQFKANTSLGVLLQGTQTLNNQVYDLVGHQEFDNTLLSFAEGISASKPISDNTSLYVQLMHSWGIPAGISRRADVERWNVKSNTVSFGLLIDLNK